MTYADQLGQAVMMAAGFAMAFQMGRDWDEFREVLARRRQRRQDRKDRR